MPTVNMYYDKDGVLRSGWTGKENKRGNVPQPPPPPPPKKAQQEIVVDLQTATNIPMQAKAQIAACAERLENCGDDWYAVVQDVASELRQLLHG